MRSVFPFINRTMRASLPKGHVREVVVNHGKSRKIWKPGNGHQRPVFGEKPLEIGQFLDLHRPAYIHGVRKPARFDYVTFRRRCVAKRVDLDDGVTQANCHGNR